MSLLSNRARAIIVSSIGGGLEIYDFTVYIFFAPIIATLFFPPSNQWIALINTFSVFAVGYLARPLGAIVFGHYGDKVGRKKGMIYSIGIMAIATMSIGLLPSYNDVGILAPILLVLLRFCQGFAIGGDLPGAMTFVAEYSDNSKRGYSCSLVYCAVNLGLLLASSIGVIITSIFSEAQLVAWGWRVAFLLGLFIGIIGLYLRNKIPETPHFNNLKQNKEIIKAPLVELFKNHRVQVLQSIGLVWLFAVVIAQLFLYMPTYLNTVSLMPLRQALLFNSVNILIFTLCIPAVGYLSDRVGRKPVIKTVALMLCIFTYPLYSGLCSTSFVAQAFALICLAVLAAGIVGTVPATLTEMFPTRVRYSGVAIAYNIGFAIFAGLTPIITTTLLYLLKFSQAPALNLMCGAVIAFICAHFIKDTRNEALDD